MAGRSFLSMTLGIAVAVLIVCDTHAQSLSECETRIQSLRIDVQSVAMTGKNAVKDRTSLLDKLDAALTKFDALKFCDAIQKLDDFEMKVRQLEAAGHVSVEDAAGLVTDADAAIDCLRTAAEAVGQFCAP